MCSLGISRDISVIEKLTTQLSNANVGFHAAQLHPPVVWSPGMFVYAEASNSTLQHEFFI